MDFEEFTQQYDEEWRKFPTDRVNRQIDKAKGKRDDYRKTADKFHKRHGNESGMAKFAREKAHKEEKRRHGMTAVRNNRTKMTDDHKARQKYTGSDLQKNVDKTVSKFQKAAQSPKTRDRRRADKQADAMYRIGKSTQMNNYKGRDGKTDNQRQAEVNKSDKEARRKAKSSMTRTNLEKLYKQESMNYSEYLEHLDAAQNPLYKVEGKLPQCPPGYVWSRERKDCIPKTDKDKISGKLQDNKDNKPQAQYNVWGRTGLNGDGYAYEEPFVRNGRRQW